MLKQKIGNLKCLDKQWGASIYRPAHPGNLAARAKHLQRTSLSNKKLKDEWENDVENDSFGDYQNGVITCMVLLDRWSEENSAHVLAPKALPRFPREKMQIWDIDTQVYFNKLVGEVTHTTPAHLKSFRQTHLVWLGLKRSKWLLILSRFQVSPERTTKNSKSCFNHQPKVQNKTKKTHPTQRNMPTLLKPSDSSVKISTGSLYLPGQSEKTHSLRVGLRLSVFAGLRLSLLSSRSLFEVRQYKSLRLKL